MAATSYLHGATTYLFLTAVTNLVHISVKAEQE